MSNTGFGLICDVGVLVFNWGVVRLVGPGSPETRRGVSLQPGRTSPPFIYPLVNLVHGSH